MHDFIAIGDIVVDAFIKLKEARVNKEDSTITLAFAEKIPYESVEEVSAVGNSPNASVAACRLGLKTALVTNLGADDSGKKCLEVLIEEGVDTQFVSVQENGRTNYHYVLWYGDDRTILVKHEAYQYKLPDFGAPKWLYLSSLGPNTEKYHEEIVQYLTSHPGVQLAFQPGTFQISLGREKLGEIYKRTKILFCNIEEGGRILGINTLGIQELSKRLKALGPEIIVITDGVMGAHAYDGTSMWHQPIYPDPKPPFERTGAGDAFSSTCVTALALGKDLQTALQWAAVNSMSVVQEIGAQKGLLNREKIEEYLEKAPHNFKTQKLN